MPEIDKLFENYIPVSERDWYPWVWPAGDEMDRLRRDKPGEYREFWRKVKGLAMGDLYFFCDEVLREKTRPPLDPTLHGELCHLAECKTDVVCLIPRGHLKTTVLTVGSTLWEMAKNPNMRHLLASDTSSVAERFMYEIKQHVDQNDRLKALFPSLTRMVGSGKKWTKSEIVVARETNVKDPTVTAMSAGMALTGTHYDRAVYDDIMTADNMRTEESIEEITRWYDATQPLLDPGSWKMVIGTRYRDNDIYGYLLDKGGIPFYVRRALEDDKPLWNRKEVIEHVRKMKRDLPPYLFSSQYLNDPVDEDNQEFMSEWIAKWGVEDVVGWMSAPAASDDLYDKWHSTLNIFMGCDPSRTVKKRSDFTAIVIVGVDAEERRIVLEYKRKRMRSPEIIRTFVEMFEKWKPREARLETVGGDEHLFPLIRNELQGKGMDYWKFKPFVTHRFMVKEDRIRQLIPAFERGLYYIHHDMNELEQELLRFPYGRHDDLIDTLAYMERQCIKPPKLADEKPKMDGWRKRRMRAGAHKGSWLTQ